MRLDSRRIHVSPFISWVSMHLAARAELRNTVIAEYSQQKAVIAARIRFNEELGEYAIQGFSESLNEQLYPTPSFSFKSFSPFPCVIIGYRSAVYGPRSAHCETWLYVFNGYGIRVVFEERRWFV